MEEHPTSLAMVAWLSCCAESSPEKQRQFEDVLFLKCFGRDRVGQVYVELCVEEASCRELSSTLCFQVCVLCLLKQASSSCGL